MNELLARTRLLAEQILDAIMPPRARAARTRGKTAEDFELTATTHALLDTQIVTLLDYKAPVVRDLIQSLKFDRSKHAARLAANILAEYLIEEIASQRLFSTKKILLVPVPLHASRERERGFNQIEFVVRELPQEMRDGTTALLTSDVLTRTRATKQQAHLSRSERLSNVAGAFAAAGEVSGTHVYLIDDVTTTGATLANAATPLKRAGASVHLIALARA